MSAGGSNRLWGGVFELAEMLEEMPGGTAFAVRDFALVTLAGELSATFPGQLAFKGGFVLRHVHGHLRFSKDVDATRHAPPGHKLEADQVAAAIRDASIHNVVQFVPDEPIDRIERNLGELAQTYDDVVPQLFPDAPSYREAADIVWPRIQSLVP